MSEDVLRKRKEELFKKFKGKNLIVYILLAVIVWFGYYVHSRNLPLLKDITTGEWISVELDSNLFYRYAQYIAEHGSLFAKDLMRNYPLGFDMKMEVPLLPHFIVYLYKFLHFFNPAVTVEQADVLYPVICFAVSMVFFFLIVRRLFNYKVALVSTAFLTVIPPYLFRTLAGSSDKEALAMMLMFMAFYLFIRGWQEETVKKSVIFGVLAGVFTGLTAMSWGGVQFAYMIIGIFGVLCILFNKSSKQYFYFYTSWFLALIFMLQFSRGGGSIISVLNSFLTSVTSSLVALAFFMGLVDFLIFKLDIFKKKEIIEKKMPTGFASFLISIILVLILVTIFIDPFYITNSVKHAIQEVLIPLPNRWVRTVAENHEPYIRDWFDQMSFWYVLLFIAGSSVLVYEALKNLKKKHAFSLATGYTALLLLFIFSRYSSSSTIFNGTTTIAKVSFIGSGIGLLAGIVIFYLYTFYKDKEEFAHLLKIDKEHVFTIVWFIILAMSARRAIRFVFVFAPITTILFGYFSVKLFDYAKEFLKKDWLKIIAYILIGYILVSTFSGFAKATLTQATYTGPSYNQQWQKAGAWIRDNTPEDAVFAHWWDYGYWVQTGGKRATILDGGNAQGYWNYLMGRHVLTGQSDEEALPFLYAHNATHLLIISDEIGKYPAYSSIGSDASYDRYSWINTFMFDEKNIQELRDKVIYLYRGGTPLDEDFVYQDKLYPKGAAGIAGFFVPIKKEDNKTMFEQPSAVLVYNGQQVQVPLDCIFIDETQKPLGFDKIGEITFGSEGLDGCLRIIPTIDGQKMLPIGAALYLSPKVSKGRFAQLYLFGKESEYFKLEYTDEAQMPLSVYQGRIIGPLKIWSISYPEDIKVPEEFYGTSFPDMSVTYI